MILPLNDKKWGEFDGGYHVKYDASIALSKLENSNENPNQIWDELWENLHHQGDVGVASYASVPQIARIIRKRQIFDWNPLALVVTIELARVKGDNLAIPEWLRSDYDQGLKDIARYVLEHMDEKWDTETLKSVLCLLAIIKGHRELGELIFEVDADDAKDILDKYFDA